MEVAGVQQTAMDMRVAQLNTRYGDDLFSDMSLKDFENDISTTSVTELSIEGWRLVIVDDNDDFAGECYPEDRVIKLAESDVANDCTLLHELIHAYIFLLEGVLGQIYPQYVTLRLFDKLRKEIPNLMEKVSTDVHIDNPAHTPLFLLKSLDLDLRCGFPLGTIYGYGRVEMFSGCH